MIRAKVLKAVRFFFFCNYSRSRTPKIFHMQSGMSSSKQEWRMTGRNTTNTGCMCSQHMGSGWDLLCAFIFWFHWEVERQFFSPPHDNITLTGYLMPAKRGIEFNLLAFLLTALYAKPNQPNVAYPTPLCLCCPRRDTLFHCLQPRSRGNK